jgi:gliding motility-associated-like protein
MSQFLSNHLTKVFIFSMILVCHTSFAQLQITNNAPFNTADYLINNVFADGSVTISNVTTFGPPEQFGYFSNGNAALGIDSGLVLGTWQLSDVTDYTNAPSWTTPPAGWNDITGQNFGLPWMGTSGANDLLAVSGSVPGLLGATFSPTPDVNSAMVISFDFVPTQDTMAFSFVFASDEWDTYPCSSFNDVFGFFVSGPGITGTYSAPPGFGPGDNVAFVPGTNIPITISSITSPTATGSCTQAYNSQYYVSANSGGLTLNARTVTIDVEFLVQACETYHFTMAIGNGDDVGLQSAVFMEGGSFGGTQPFSANIEPVINTIGGDSVIYEGCAGIDFFLRRSDTSTTDTIPIIFQGTATPGVDTDPIPGSIIFPQGQDTLGFTFNIPDDGILEGPETLIIIIDDSTLLNQSCGSFDGDTLILEIRDAVPFTTDGSVDTIMCTDTDPLIGVGTTSGIGPFTYQWSTGQSTDSITVPAPTGMLTEYVVTVTDACGLFTEIDTAQVYVINPNVQINADSVVLECDDIGGTVHVSITDSMPGLQYSWSNGVSSQSFFQSNPYTTTSYIVTVTQACAGVSLIDTFTIVVNNAPIIMATENDTLACVGDTIELASHPNYFTNGMTFEWSNGSTDTSQLVIPTTVPFTYYVSATDACGDSTTVDSITIFPKQYDPIQIFVDNDTINCKGDSFQLGPPVIVGGSGDFRMTWRNWLNTVDSIVGFTNNTKTFTLQVEDRCSVDTVSTTAKAVVRVHPAITILPIDTVICAYPRETLNLTANADGGYGDLSYLWSDSTIGSTLSIPMDDGGQYRVTVTDLCGDQIIQNTAITYNRVPETSIERSYRYFRDTEWTDVQNQDVLIEEQAPASIIFRPNGALIPPDTVFWDLWLNGNISNAGEGWPLLSNNPVEEFLYGKEGEYEVRLVVKTPEGCTDTNYASHRTIIVENPPNVFSPNGDGVNDVFYLKGIEGLRDFKCEIYNRWGLKVYEWEDPYQGWDGSGSEDGTYFYIVTGKRGNGQDYVDKGTVTLFKGQ